MLGELLSVRVFMNFGFYAYILGFQQGLHNLGP